ncbi:MAG: CHAP domain-containing protein [Leucobacter sp.]
MLSVLMLTAGTPQAFAEEDPQSDEIVAVPEAPPEEVPGVPDVDGEIDPVEPGEGQPDPDPTEPDVPEGGADDEISEPPATVDAPESSEPEAEHPADENVAVAEPDGSKARAGAAVAGAITWYNYSCYGFADCNAKGMGNAGFEKVYKTSFWNMAGGHHCTNYVAYRMQKNGVKQFTVPGNSNATMWGTHAVNAGLKVDKSNPQPGDIAWWTEAQYGYTYGHVAYVESVDAKAGTFIVSQDATGYNFSWRKFKISEVSGFIHVGKAKVNTTGTPVTAVANKDGRLEVYAVGKDGKMYKRYQKNPGGPLVDWYAFSNARFA